MTSEQMALPPKLPVARTVVDGYWWAIWHLRSYSAIALVWAALTGGMQLLLGDLMQVTAHVPVDAFAISAAISYAPGLAIFAATFLGAAVIAVASYRLVILDEPTDWRRALRLGRRELRMFGLSVLLYVVVVGEILALTLILHLLQILDATGDSSPQTGDFVLLVMMAILWSLLIALTLMPFIGLAFPLTAVDASSGLFRRSFRMSRGNRLRLAYVVFIANFLWVFASYIPWALAAWSGWEVPESLQVTLSTFITLLAMAFGSMVLGKAFTSIGDAQHEGVYGVFD